MEVHGRQPNDRRPESERLRETTRERTRAARREVQSHGVPEGKALRNDVIDLSTAANDRDTDARRAEKVDGLARAHRDGKLLTTDRIDRAADRMLSD